MATDASSLAARFALVIDGLCRAIAAHMAKNPASVPLLLLTWAYLRRKAARVARLLARPCAGPVAVRRQAPEDPAPRPPRRAPRLPRGRSWLIRLVPEAAIFGSQLQHLMTQPEMAALLQAAPQAASIFRPLRHMLSPGAAPTPPTGRHKRTPRQTPATRRPGPASVAIRSALQARAKLSRPPDRRTGTDSAVA